MNNPFLDTQHSRNIHGHMRKLAQYIDQAVLLLCHLIASWLIWAENECTLHVALPNQPISQFKPVQQIRQLVPKNLTVFIYILCKLDFSSLCTQCCTQTAILAHLSWVHSPDQVRSSQPTNLIIDYYMRSGQEYENVGGPMKLKLMGRQKWPVRSVQN